MLNCLNNSRAICCSPTFFKVPPHFWKSAISCFRFLRMRQHPPRAMAGKREGQARKNSSRWSSTLKKAAVCVLDQFAFLLSRSLRATHGRWQPTHPERICWRITLPLPSPSTRALPAPSPPSFSPPSPKLRLLVELVARECFSNRQWMRP